MSNHLTLSDRIVIERGINNDLTFATIARMLDRSPSSISREVKKYRVVIQSNHSFNGNDCTKRISCLRNKICDKAPFHGCTLNRCKSCPDVLCTTLCPVYESPNCEKLDKPPYVCIGCEEQKRCKKNHAYYSANRADSAHKRNVRDSHKGIRMSPEELAELGELIQPLIKRGQSLNHICATLGDKITVSEKTLYNYIDNCVFEFRNIDLPKKVKYKHRREKKVLTKYEYQYRRGRTYEDFKAFLEANPGISVTELDTVKGKRNGGGKVLLTMIINDTAFMPVFMMRNCTQESVLSVFDHLTDLLGLETFRKLFPVFLTDNGVEFKDPESLEYTSNGCPRTKIFIPKSTNLNTITAEQVHLATCHVNSYYREEYGNKTPFEMMTSKAQKKLLSSLELSPIPPAEVLLKPELLK